MAISDWVEKLGRTIFESPFAAVDTSRQSPELAEVRLAVLEAVKAKSHRVSGRPVFPYNVVRVLFRGVPDAQSEVFRGGFFPRFCEQEIRSALTAGSYRFPEDLHVQVATTPALPVGEEGWLAVETESRTAPAAGPVKKAGRLIVVNGTANEKELPLTKARTNIGRTVDIFKADGPSRRNDLAFADTGDVNRSVSREHAHILYSKRTGEYRLFNDRWQKTDARCGVWIIRDGLSRAVHRDARGARLQPGDEIHLGRAIVRFVLK